MLDALLIGIPVFLAVFVLLLAIAAPLFIDINNVKPATSYDFNVIYQFYKNVIGLWIITFAAISLVLSLFACSGWQATPGKRLAGIYIIDEKGGKPKFLNLLGRFYSLPLFILMLQIFERAELYKRLDQIKASGKTVTDIADLEKQLQIGGPVFEITNIIVLVTISFWFLRILFTPTHTALHDVLFRTKVVQGKI